MVVSIYMIKAGYMIMQMSFIVIIALMNNMDCEYDWIR